MQSSPASIYPRFAGSPSRAPSASRARPRSAWRPHLAACVTGGVAVFLLTYAAFQLAGAITGWHPPRTFGAAPPIPLFWRLEVAGLTALATMALLLPACRIDMERTRRWMGRALSLAILAVSVVAMVFP